MPGPGEVGHETWEDGSWEYTGSSNVWTVMSADEELGYAYLPTATPTHNWYGGHRPGDNLFAESLVCLECEAGRRVWHYQLVHHGLWDYDSASAPILADITVDGRPIKEVAQVTKQAFTYVFDRVTGEPVWPIEERPVEAGDVPGEWYAPTQPFPTKPPAYDRQGVTIDDLIDFTPELRAKVLELVSRYKLGPIFTPPVVSQRDGPLGTLMLPNISGGANWPGGSLDPETGIVYVGSHTSIMSLALVRPSARSSDMNFVVGTAVNTAAGDDGSTPVPVTRLNVEGLPLVKPPYGRITAIDLNNGEIVWQIADGETPDSVKNHPSLKDVHIPRTGSSGGGTLVTKTLLIAGEKAVFTTPTGRRGAMLRAYDKATGEEVGTVYLPAGVTGVPMTYLVDGTQFLAVAIGGAGYSANCRR